MTENTDYGVNKERYWNTQFRISGPIMPFYLINSDELRFKSSSVAFYKWRFPYIPIWGSSSMAFSQNKAQYHGFLLHTHTLHKVYSTYKYDRQISQI